MWFRTASEDEDLGQMGKTIKWRLEKAQAAEIPGEQEATVGPPPSFNGVSIDAARNVPNAAVTKFKVMEATSPLGEIEGSLAQDEPGEDWLSRVERHITTLRSQGLESQAREAERLRDKKLSEQGKAPPQTAPNPQ